MLEKLHGFRQPFEAIVMIPTGLYFNRITLLTRSFARTYDAYNLVIHFWVHCPSYRFHLCLICQV
jgi:hypothetical protein